MTVEITHDPESVQAKPGKHSLTFLAFSSEDRRLGKTGVSCVQDPFFHGGQDGRQRHFSVRRVPCEIGDKLANCRWRWEPTGLSNEGLTERGLMVEDVSWRL